jgi:FkbM family methyltransferase
MRNIAVRTLSIAAHPFLQPLWSVLSLLSRYMQGLGSGSTISRSGELHVIDLVARTVLPVYFDVGGNMGHYTAALLARRPSAEIHVFEPSRPLAAEVRRRFPEVTVNECGLSDRVEEKTLVAVHEGATTSTFHHGDGTYQHSERVTCTTLDAYCETHKIERIGLVKVDVEGHELNVLLGAKRMLGTHAIDAIQFDGGAAVNSRTFFFDFWKLLRSYGYAIHRVLPAGLVPITEYRGQDECCLPTIYLALRP